MWYHDIWELGGLPRLIRGSCSPMFFWRKFLDPAAIAVVEVSPRLQTRRHKVLWCLIWINFTSLGVTNMNMWICITVPLWQNVTQGTTLLWVIWKLFTLYCAFLKFKATKPFSLPFYKWNIASCYWYVTKWKFAGIQGDLDLYHYDKLSQVNGGLGSGLQR